MYEMRRFKAEQAVQPDLTRRAGDEVASANDLGHARQAVIDRHGELVGENAVRAPDNEITAFLRQVLAVRAEHAVGKRDDLVGHAHARCRRTFFPFFFDLRRREIPAGPGIQHAAVRKMRRTRGVQRGPGAEARIKQPLFAQDLLVFFINRRPLGLIRHLAVPVETEPAQIVHNEIRVAARAAHRVKILDPQQERAVLMPCAQPRKQRAQHVSKVHAPARTGRKASDCLHRQSLPSVFSLRLFYHIAHIHCNSPVFLL